LIAERLRGAGCRHAFGIPGGEVLAMMAALADHGIRFTLCKHENAGGFMAEGAHHATGAPAILLATLGPGLANAVNTIANAWQDQVPLIVLSGAVDAAEAATYTHQVFDHGALIAPVAKGSFTVADGAVAAIVDKAIALSLADPPGPVHIDVPITLAGAEQPVSDHPPTARPAPAAPAPGPELDRARARLAEAERPILVAGVGVLHHDASGQIRAVVERFAIPLVTTYKAKGVLPEDHPLSLGGHGLSPLSDGLVLPLLAQADLVLAVGYDPIEMRAGWRQPWAPGKAIELSHIPNRHGMHGAGLSFVGHVGRGLEAVTAGVARRPAVWPGGEPAKARAALAEAFADRPAWGPHAAFAAARRASPPETVVTADSGAHRILLSQMWQTPAPRHLVQSTALCTMGCALPLAIGHKLARPETPVLAVMGDAGLEMVLGELATLRDLALPVAVLVLVDRSLALIELKQRGAGLANLGVDFGATDFVAVAEALGGVGVGVRDAASLEAALGEAYARDRFTLIACEIGPKAYDGAF